MMKQRNIKVIGLIFAVLIFSVIVLFAHEILALKKICFYDYDFTDKNSITKDFETLGFTRVEDEKSMRRKMQFEYTIDSMMGNNSSVIFGAGMNPKYVINSSFLQGLNWFFGKE